MLGSAPAQSLADLSISLDSGSKSERKTKLRLFRMAAFWWARYKSAHARARRAEHEARELRIMIGEV